MHQQTAVTSHPYIYSFSTSESTTHRNYSIKIENQNNRYLEESQQLIEKQWSIISILKSQKTQFLRLLQTKITLINQQNTTITQMKAQIQKLKIQSFKIQEPSKGELVDNFKLMYQTLHEQTNELKQQNQKLKIQVQKGFSKDVSQNQNNLQSINKLQETNSKLEQDVCKLNQQIQTLKSNLNNTNEELQKSNKTIEVLQTNKNKLEDQVNKCTDWLKSVVKDNQKYETNDFEQFLDKAKNQLCRLQDKERFHLSIKDDSNSNANKVSKITNDTNMDKEKKYVEFHQMVHETENIKRESQISMGQLINVDSEENIRSEEQNKQFENENENDGEQRNKNEQNIPKQLKFQKNNISIQQEVQKQIQFNQLKQDKKKQLEKEKEENIVKQLTNQQYDRIIQQLEYNNIQLRNELNYYRCRLKVINNGVKGNKQIYVMKEDQKNNINTKFEVLNEEIVQYQAISNEKTTQIEKGLQNNKQVGKSDKAVDLNEKGVAQGEVEAGESEKVNENKSHQLNIQQTNPTHDHEVSQNIQLQNPDIQLNENNKIAKPQQIKATQNQIKQLSQIVKQGTNDQHNIQTTNSNKINILESQKLTLTKQILQKDHRIQQYQQVINELNKIILQLRQESDTILAQYDDNSRTSVLNEDEQLPNSQDKIQQNNVYDSITINQTVSLLKTIIESLKIQYEQQQLDSSSSLKKLCGKVIVKAEQLYSFNKQRIPENCALLNKPNNQQILQEEGSDNQDNNTDKFDPQITKKESLQILKLFSKASSAFQPQQLELISKASEAFQQYIPHKMDDGELIEEKQGWPKINRQNVPLLFIESTIQQNQPNILTRFRPVRIDEQNIEQEYTKEDQPEIQVIVQPKSSQNMHRQDIENILSKLPVFYIQQSSDKLELRPFLVRTHDYTDSESIVHPIYIPKPEQIEKEALLAFTKQTVKKLQNIERYLLRSKVNQKVIEDLCLSLTPSIFSRILLAKNTT